MQAADVHGVAQCGNKQQHDAFQTYGALAFAAAQKKYPEYGQQHGTYGDERGLFMKEQNHDDHDHERIEKLKRGGDAARQVVEALKHEKCRKGVHDAEEGEAQQLSGRGGQSFVTEHGHGQYGQRSEEEAVEEHAFRRHAVMQKRQAEERNESERGGREKSKQESQDGLRVFPS